MKINERLYPHPVLAYFSDDLIKSLFQVTPKVTVGKHAYKFDIIARTSSADLRELINQNKAQYALHIECAATRYRKIIPSFSDEFTSEIPADLLDGRVELCSFIVATQDITEYKNQNFHPDYGDTKFTVKKGDVLAVGQDNFFDAVKQIDPLQHISSIFKVRINKNDIEPFTMQLLDENIVILLSENNFDAYSQLRQDQNKHTILASMMILPALVHVLEIIKASIADPDEGSDYSEKRWYSVIYRKLKEKGYKPEQLNTWTEESSLVLAQKLIGDPLTASLSTMLSEEESFE